MLYTSYQLPDGQGETFQQLPAFSRVLLEQLVDFLQNLHDGQYAVRACSKGRGGVQVWVCMCTSSIPASVLASASCSGSFMLSLLTNVLMSGQEAG